MFYIILYIYHINIKTIHQQYKQTFIYFLQNTEKNNQLTHLLSCMIKNDVSVRIGLSTNASSSKDDNIKANVKLQHYIF